ncbi:CRISPR system precrRNA processing endoribonuclease RAMP protein Cas6 [uncultured Thiothrix sp.]|uniref:CRISPR system precrRNA processing endoribonuclease RAMP protein Cas6 n=1 Tax=uncultured Thiothrix sp. TaxID=223185 RepID=UPI00263A04E9|nr:CRISPR system precrRNA processing endoribonuclease RAMP protein Cas6 [uncultured Thiothrix sp.]
MTMALNLPIARYQFELRASTALSFPPYAGSTWRGAFGNALKRAVCVTGQPHCTGCLLQRRCVYSQVFETPAGAEPLLSKGNAAPHPFILHPLATSGQQYQAGDRLRIQLSLIGQAIQQLPYFIHSIQQMGQRGVGTKLGRYEVLKVWQETSLGADSWACIYETGKAEGLQALDTVIPALPNAPEHITLRFKTPFRGVHGGRLMNDAIFDLAGFLMGLLRRLSLLSAYHAQTRLELDFKAFSTAARQLTAYETELRGFAWTRYSSRQQGLIAMDGLLGEFSLAGEAWQSFWPWLWWGQWVHTGKGTVMGQGEYELQVIA